MFNVELRNGTDESNGNVYVSGKPVCDDDWDKVDADVVCQELGFRKAVYHTVGSVFGKVSPDFAMDNVKCSGIERRLKDCLHTTHENCGPGEGAGVVCVPTAGKLDVFALSMIQSFNSYYKHYFEVIKLSLIHI